MLREETVFGPIRSRRLGNSLGINLLPVNGKICNFDCVYCECGWNADGMEDRTLPSFREVCDALENGVKKCHDDGTPVDTITFSGNGEPTLHPDFPAIIEKTLEVRAKYYPSAKVSVLSNATQLGRPGVKAALAKVDNPILKLDAPTTALAARINKPSGGYDVEAVVENMKAFNGDFILQTMFLSCPDFDSSSPEVLLPWMDIVRLLKPREVMVYTIDRPTPQAGLVRFSEEKMRELVSPLIQEGFKIQIKG